MIKGEKIKVGGEEMVLPPLNLDDVEQHWLALIDGSLFKNLNGCAEIFHSALVRNYPDLTLAEIKAKMTPGELVLNLQILMKQSGFVVPGETPRGSKGSQTGQA
jgi:hypothetical protein